MVVSTVALWGATPIFTEDFESLDKGDLGSWTVETTGNSSKATWDITSASLSSKKSAAGGGVDFDGETQGTAALISENITLPAGKEYKLDLLWQASYAATITNPCSDFQVWVREAGSTKWETILISSDEQSVRNSTSTYPWTGSSNWPTTSSTLDISDYAGKTINVAFVWIKNAFEKGYANLVTIDDISIEEYSRITTPVLECATKSYTFPSTWVGGTSNSEAFTIKNVGVGTLTLSSISGLEGSDFEAKIDPTSVKLAKGESTSFNVRYNPTLTGAPTATMTFNLNDGGAPVSVTLKGTKKIMPTGYSYEGFEGGTFPPVGWTSVGNWKALQSSFAGDWCAYVNLTQEEKHELITPRLDLSGSDNYTLSFRYLDQWDQTSDDTYEPENYVVVYLSTDGGETWSDALWTNTAYNETVTATVDLGAPDSDNCYVKFVYYIPDFDATTYDYEYTTFFLDDVVLPPLYGATSAPVATSPVTPADNATDVVNSSLVLSWKEAQFAESYKVSLGTASNTFDLIDSQVVTGTTLAAPRLDYNTKYYWKVVPCNSYGEASDVDVWSFKTMNDQSIKTFPHFEGFEDRDNELPLGWNVINEGSTKWQITKISPYDGKQSAFAQGNTSGTEATLVTPEIVLPADDDITITFFWGNNPPAALSKDTTGASTNTTIESDGIEVSYFEINDGSGWTTLKLISKDSEYWDREAISLKNYAGKIVQLRWRYDLVYANQRRGLCLDNITLQSSSNSSFVYFNTTEWAAGEVNNGRSLNSANKVYLINSSTEAATVKSVTFGDSAFSSDLKADTKLDANSAQKVVITYNAGTLAREVASTMTVNFTNGVSVSLPVSATTLADDIRYYSFENDEFGSLQPEGLTTIDVDKQATVMSSIIKWPHRGEAFAYIVIDVTSDHADWRNVYPHSGDKVLAAFRTQTENIDAEDWIVSPLLSATSESKFRFFGKSYGTTDDYNDFLPHYFEVWVSTTDPTVAGMTEKAKSQTELAYSADQSFTEYTVDLSKWAGKNIYVGLKHTTTISGYVAFFDDFYFEHFSGASSISNVAVDANNGIETYYNLQGVAVDGNDLQPGIYIRRCGGKAEKVVIK